MTLEATACRITNTQADTCRTSTRYYGTCLPQPIRGPSCPPRSHRRFGVCWLSGRSADIGASRANSGALLRRTWLAIATASGRHECGFPGSAAAGHRRGWWRRQRTGGLFGLVEATCHYQHSCGCRSQIAQAPSSLPRMAWLAAASECVCAHTCRRRARSGPGRQRKQSAAVTGELGRSGTGYPGVVGGRTTCLDGREVRPSACTNSAFWVVSLNAGG